jgi:hypothetical protein
MTQQPMRIMKEFDRLSIWFIIHGAVDVLLAIPLFVIPDVFLEAVGWSAVDPLLARLVAAALFGIGVESLIGFRVSVVTFRAILNLKMVWSSAAIIGILWTILAGDAPETWFVWAVLGLFVVFDVLWIRWRFRTAGLLGSV